MNEIDRQQRLAIASGLNKVRRGRMKRRDFLNLAAQAGFGFAGVHLLNACSSPKRSFTQPNYRQISQDSAAIALTEKYQFLKEFGKTTAIATLRIITEETPPSVAMRSLTQQEFVPVTGILVTKQQSIQTTANEMAKLAAAAVNA